MRPDEPEAVDRFGFALLPIDSALVSRSCKEDVGFPSFPYGTRVAPSEVQNELSSSAVVADPRPAMRERPAFKKGMSMEEARPKENSQDPGELLCSVFAHEIANSLHSISAVASCMERHLYETGHIDKPTGESLRLVTEEIKRLTLLLEDFRSSRLFSLDLQPTSLANVIEDCLALESSEATQRQIRMECDVRLDLPPIMADAAKLKQVFLNLYTNAVEAMGDGGILGVKAMEREEKLCLEISDSGEGIPEGMEIFEPFVTNKPHGTGLGLAVVKWIVLAHGGTISYKSNPGEGTIFHLCFPIRRSDGGSDQSPHRTGIGL